MREHKEIGIGREARTTYHLDDVAVVPSRRTRSSKDVDTRWKIDAYEFETPFLSHATDALATPEFIIEMDKQGGLGVINAEGLWGRETDLNAAIEQIREALEDEDDEWAATRVLQQMHQKELDLDLLGERIAAVRSAGAIVAVRVSPQHARELAPVLQQAGLHLLVVQGTVVSAEHVTKEGEPLNLKEFIGSLDTPVIAGSVSDYHTALHLMRTGAAGVIIGAGDTTNWATSGINTPMATAIADAAAARRDYLDETGGRYVHIIADGEIELTGDAVKAIACGADAVTLGAPLAKAKEAAGEGLYWQASAAHPKFPRSLVEQVQERDELVSLEQVLHGPSSSPLGEYNFNGALRRSLGKCGYTDLKSFQKVQLDLV
ncbi:GuaB3 family IMP dehydrogenase-related protein [Corynebacterium pyruviciproducens]|uniref:IMP dehydrogenase n=2 Tax=Corynebacterium pyruviciproducens TaxID=598660 RepID=S2YTT6_9CORY|nr:GuaB3 family IMP dehydrogenase-related protein [Corynebacterium pyruviciproducens]EPD67741.1 IMP dehydrogenase [Corynebacterium pyruviciproducens ATCC BAA-1742]MDH4657453.1 GuaB3 family IMP dehydrogenase-related protein [Corynebacterium pyruviciproducens]MDK7213302.1 GuaB3 family IMP dehydrogenase-related protein [Corynebacterium pyruviciproducens]WOT01568.1 GuaB3 family IMP dehydrogenase-related protein [Corynebacterium pyruviciproducens]